MTRRELIGSAVVGTVATASAEAMPVKDAGESRSDAEKLQEDIVIPIRASVRMPQPELEAIVETLPSDVRERFYKARELNERLAHLQLDEMLIRKQCAELHDPRSQYVIDGCIDIYPDRVESYMNVGERA